MEKEELRRVSRELDISLPDSYVSTMEEYPVPALAGNADTDLWDDADAIIERNRELREGVGAPASWPPSSFLHGGPTFRSRERDRPSYPEGPVWWVDHCDVDAKSSGVISPSFRQWVDEWNATARDDLAKDGVDAEAPRSAGTAGCSALLIGLPIIALIRTMCMRHG